MNIYTGKINVDDTEVDRSNLLKKLGKYNDRSSPGTAEGKNKKEILIKVHMIFMKVEN